MARLHLAEAIAGDLTVPVAAQEAHPSLRQRTPRGLLRPARPAAAGEIPAADARAASELLQRAQERVPRAGIPGGHASWPSMRQPLPSPTPCPMRMRAPALRAAEGQVRHAGAPDHPADRLPVAGRGRGCGRQASRKARPSRRLRPSATSLPRSLELGTFTKAEMLDPGRGRRGLRPRSRARRARRSRAASARCSCASPRSSPRRSGPSRRSPRSLQPGARRRSAPKDSIERDP